MLLSVALYTAVAGAQVNIPDESPIIRIDLNTTADLEADASATIINIDDALDGPLVATAWSAVAGNDMLLACGHK